MPLVVCSQVQTESVRVLHQVLWHVRRRQEENVSAANSFHSLLVEHAELHKSTCTNILLNYENGYSKPLQIMAGMQLQEVYLDEQDVQQVWSEMAVQQQLGK